MIGFGNPPDATKYKKGQSGNPNGRPRGSKNTYTLLDEIVNEKVTIQKNGRTFKITKKQAALFQLSNQAATGHLKAIQTLIPLMSEADRQKEERTKITGVIRQDDAKIIEQFIKDNLNG